MTSPGHAGRILPVDAHGQWETGRGDGADDGVDPLTPHVLVVVAGVAFLAAFVQGVAGFGSALVAMPLLSLVLEVRDAAALVALLSLAINAALLLPVRRELPWRRVAPLLAGSLAGIPAGVLLLAGADPRLARGLLGAALVATSAALLRERRPKIGEGRGAALAAGALAGLLGGAFNMNGPVVTLYAAARGWEKRETHAALQLYFLASGLAIAALHGAVGITRGPVLLASAAALPFLAAGSLAGWSVHLRVGEGRYRVLLRASLLAAGAALLAAAARG